MNLWLLFGGLLGGLVFAGVIFWAFQVPDGGDPPAVSPGRK